MNSLIKRLNMNILHVIPYLNPKRGGDVNVCSNLATEFVKRGHEVTILTTDFDLDSGYKQLLEKKGVNVVNLTYLFNFGLLVFSPSIKGWLEKNIKRYNVVHLHTFRSYQNIIVYKTATKYKIPYIIQAHGSVLPFFQKTFLKKIYDYIWGYTILKNSTKVIAGTSAESEQYLKMRANKDQIEIIPNAIDFSQFEKMPKGFFREKYSIKESEKIILYLGRINRIKGINLLLDSFKELITYRNDVKLVLIGPDDGFLSELGEQMDEIGDRIIYTGLVPEEIKLEAYADADIYILPSIYDNFPITVLESLASATPVIVTNRCVIADIVKNVGIVVDYNPKSLNEVVMDLLDNDELILELGKKSRDLIKSEFTFEKIGKMFENLYESINRS